MKKKKTQLNFQILFASQGKKETDDEVKLLVENIEYYRGLMGWTRKRVYLMGAATMIGKNNIALVKQIAEYLSGPKPFSESKERGNNEDE